MSLLRTAWWGVVARFLIHGLVVSTWVSRIASVKASLQLSDGQLGFSLLGTAVGSVSAIPIAGWWVTRYGSRRTAAWSSAGFCAALAAPPFARGAWSLFAVLIVYGFMAGANDVAMNSNAVGVEKRMGTATMSRFHAMFSIGGILGAALGGAVASRGISPAVHLPVAGVVLLLAAIATGPMLVETEREHGTRPAGGAPKQAGWRQYPAPLFILSAIGFCIFLSEGAIADWTAVYLAQILHAGPGIAASGYAVFSASMAVFRLLGDAITVRLGRASTIRIGGALAGAGVAWMLLVSSPYASFPGLVLAGAGYSSIIPLVFAAAGRIRGMEAGPAVATVSGLGYLGFLFGPPVIGAVSELTNLRTALWLLVLLAAAASLLVSAVKRDRHGSAPW